MKEIKFRAWDKKTKTMRWVLKMGWDLDDNISEVTLGFKIRPFEKRRTSFVLMQYTGLKDKNGKEIYEGDVVSGWFDDNKFTSLVEWEDGGFVLQVQGDYRPYIGETAPSQFAVIGNIYKNP